MPRPSHSSRFYHPHSIGWEIQIMKLLAVTVTVCKWNSRSWMSKVLSCLNKPWHFLKCSHSNSNHLGNILSCKGVCSVEFGSCHPDSAQNLEVTLEFRKSCAPLL
jgi:hypothetical protein